MASTSTKEKLALLKKLHSQQEELYAAKNEKYGDSFSKTFAEYGPEVALARMEDKLSRAKALVRAGLNDANGESLIDTLGDMANYANMFIIELAGPEDFPTGGESKRKPRRKRDQGSDSLEEDPLGGFTKSQLAQLVKELGGEVPKRSNRKKLATIINEFPKNQVAKAITAISQVDSEDSDDGEEEE